ncbi:unnamed protein product [Parascedosporium putredinis]|uniref:RRM domain-containing protein n=1 Tax=Parascedosporium putredinis TaxID=1442378 RepID=A0A9P1MAV4_9PEZI|nr:unnamed protein product [Parascedosporium putredinis]CAI7998356.1 unnamed protein product [Parascedosporium putredinis]
MPRQSIAALIGLSANPRFRAKLSFPGPRLHDQGKDLSEEQIIEIFSSAGKVLNFRLVYDRETGRPKGFGFAEYPDADSASSAVRNLHNYEIKGRRLRVDFSNEGGADEEDGDNVGDQHDFEISLRTQT